MSYHLLKRLVALNADLAGVVTAPPSGFNADYADLTPFCRTADIPFRVSRNINSAEDITWVRDRRPDVIFCFGWSQLLKKKILQTAPMGVIGFHPAELPQNRGRHPLIWAIALGLEKTASTFFFMDEGIDSGDILNQRPVPIFYKDDAQTLYNRVLGTALDQMTIFLPELIKGEYSRYAQNTALANYWRKRHVDDGLIDFRMTSRAIYNLVRALTRPYVGAHLNYQGVEFKVWRTEEVEEGRDNDEPGKVLDVLDGRPLVKCQVGAVRLLEHEIQVLPEVGGYIK